MRTNLLHGFLASLLLLLLATPPLVRAAGPAEKTEPGGSGTIGSHILVTRCFAPRSGVVTEVCADYTIHWKMWALMGEPVGNYTLRWTLDTITLMDAKRKSRVTYQAAALPQELRKPAGAIELYLDGYASVVRGPGAAGLDTGYRHAFNTGVAVRAGIGSSYNVPGSPDWSRIFEQGTSPCDASSHAIGGFYLDRHTFVDAKDAKARFAAGLGLTDFRACKASSVGNTDALESAIGKLCEKKGAGDTYAFCPKAEKENRPDIRRQDTEAERKREEGLRKPQGVGASALDGGASGAAGALNAGRLLDAPSERPAILQRLETEKASFRRASEPACRKVMGDIDACFAKTSCARPAESPSVERCRAIPNYPSKPMGALLTRVPQPGELCYRNDEACREAKARVAREEAREDEERHERQRAWRATYGELSEQCGIRSKEREQFASCQKQHAPTCNPRGFTGLDQCLDDQQATRGPRESDARALMEKEWATRSRTGSSITGSILD